MTIDAVRTKRPPDRPKEHAERELAAVQQQIAERRMELATAWRKSTTADRLLGIQRLIQDGGMAADVIAKLEELHERVRAAWAIVRTDRKKLDAASRHRVLRAEMDLQLAEGERDRFIADARLELELYRAAESFIMGRAYSPDYPPLKALMMKKHALELEVLAGMSAVDDDTRTDHQTQVVRILSALTWSGEGMPIT
jgi:hypothetical protein